MLPPWAQQQAIPGRLPGSHTVTTPGVVPVGLVSTYDLALAAFERADHPEAEVYHEEHAYAPEAEGVTEPYHYGEDSPGV